jgi:amino acid permease
MFNILILYRSFSEIGYILLGRKSVFIINAIVFIGCFQLMILYFIIIGDILSSFASQILNQKDTFLTTRPLYVVLVGFILSPFIFKKEIHELKFASFMLFIAIFLFVVVFIFQLISAGTDQNLD